MKECLQISFLIKLTHNMRQVILSKPEPCVKCEEEIPSGSYAYVDDFEEYVICESCQQNIEETNE